jgi:integrase
MPDKSFDRFRAETLAFLRPRRAAKTYGKYRQVLTEIAALPGVREASDLTPATIASWLDAMPPSRSDVTRLKLLVCLASICRRASRPAGPLRADPFASVPVREWGLDSTPLSSPTFVPVKKISAFLRRLSLDQTWEGRRLHALAALVAFTGLRRGEALHLRRGDVDLRRGFVAVKRCAAHRPKTKASAANVPLPPQLVKVLRSWLKLNRGAWVFPNLTRDTPWVGGRAGKRPLDRLKSEAKKCGIPNLTFQLLRVSFATNAPRFGLDLDDVKKILRHTNMRTTETYYVRPDDARIAVKARGIRFPNCA